MNRQYLIAVNGQFQFMVSSTDTPEVVAERAADAMKLGNVRPVISRGQINFVPVTL